jgi:hypothetical protein
MNVPRRLVLSGVVLPCLGGLAGCAAIENSINGAGTVNTANLQTLLADVQSIDVGLTQAIKQLQADRSIQIPQSVWASIDAALAGVQSAAASISGATDITSSSTVGAARALATAVNALISTAAAIPVIPPPYRTALEAASALLPLIEATVGIAGALLATPVKLTPVAAKAYLDYLGAGGTR